MVERGFAKDRFQLLMICLREAFVYQQIMIEGQEVCHMINFPIQVSVLICCGGCFLQTIAQIKHSRFLKKGNTISQDSRTWVAQYAIAFA